MTGNASDVEGHSTPCLGERQSNSRLHIVDEGSLHHYRTEIPNTLIRGRKGRGLSVYAKWLYVYLKSVAGDCGMCWQSTATIARETGMSVGRLHAAKRELETHRLIRIVHGRNPRRYADRIRIIDIWPANMFEFNQRPGQPEADHEQRDDAQDEAATTPDISDSIHPANTVPAPQTAEAPDEPQGDAAVFTRRIQCSPDEYSVHQVNGRRSHEEDLTKKKNEEREGTARAHEMPSSGHFMPQKYIPSPDLLEQLTKDCPNIDIPHVIKRCMKTQFLRAILDPAVRLHKFCLEEEEKARDLMRRYPTRAAPQPLLDERLSQKTSDMARDQARLIQRLYSPHSPLQAKERTHGPDPSRLLPVYDRVAASGRSVS